VVRNSGEASGNSDTGCSAGDRQDFGCRLEAGKIPSSNQKVVSYGESPFLLVSGRVRYWLNRSHYKEADMSDVIRNVTIALKLRPDAPPDIAQFTQGVRQYYGEILTNAANATTANNLLGESYRRIADLSSRGGSGGGLGPSVEGMQSLDQAAQATQKFADEIDRLITSGMKFSTIEGAVQQFATATMDAMNVDDPAQRMMGIQQIMEDARKHVERYQEMDTATTQKMSRNWQGAQNSMMQAVSAASRLVSAVGFLTGSSDDVEELAKRFASVQMSINAMSASSAMFNNASEGLQRMGVASQAAQTQLAMLGGSAGFTTRILAGVGPAATAMQAALGPISLVITGIGLAFTVAQTAAAIWGEKSTESAENSEEALRKYEEQLRAVSRELDAQTRLIDNQTRSTMMLYDAKKMASGGKFSLEDAVATGQDMAITNQTAEKKSMEAALAKAREALPEAIKTERALIEEEIRKREQQVAAKEADLRQWSKLSGKSMEDLIAGQKRMGQSSEITSAQADEIDPWGALQLQKDKLAQFDRMRGVSGLENSISSGDPAQIAGALKDLRGVLPQSVDILEKANLDAMQARQASPKFVIDEVNQLIREEIQRAKGQGIEIGKGADGKYMVDADREIEKATKSFEAEMRIAQNLMADPAKFAELQFGVNTAQNPIAALQGISQYVPDEEEQALRNNPNLSIANVQAALADAAEFDEEKAKLQETVERLQGVVAEYRQSMGKLVDVVEEMQGEARKTANDLKDVIRAGR